MFFLPPIYIYIYNVSFKIVIARYITLYVKQTAHMSI